MAGQALPVSPLALPMPEMPPVPGVQVATGMAEIRYRAREDVMAMAFPAGTTAAGVFTKNRCPGAPVEWSRAALKGGKARGLVVTSGNSNVFTGKAGRETCARTAEEAARILGCKAKEIFLASTGVIGERLPTEKLVGALPKVFGAVAESGFAHAARAIMTTDTFPKGAAATVQGNGGTIHIAGIAKGSGMIAPDMATMLVYIFTDAKISQASLQKMVDRNLGGTFNSITVDSDTSTSDTLLVAATGQSPAAAVTGAVAKAFETALASVMRDLALQVVRDGEGATKLVEVRVTGAASDEDAAKVAFSVANSPLVKTAVAGEDPNWGRIVAAIGKSGAAADRDRLTIRFGDILVAEKGWRAPSYTEEAGATYMQQAELVFAIDLGMGRAKRSVWTCDLTARYVEINADYRS